MPKLRRLPRPLAVALPSLVLLALLAAVPGAAQPPRAAEATSAAADTDADTADAATAADERPRVVGEEVVVTATGLEERLEDAAASVVVLGEAELASAAALALDDVLRRVPGFTLFRRSGSRSANPTIQGASLRGVGGSGAGRALVLADGVPLADPFGGWVAWGRVPRAAVERVEVVRGGASGLYGSSALAGVVHLVRRTPEEHALVVDLSAGSQETAAGSAWGSLRRGTWTGAAAAGAASTEGYVPVAPEARGAVDRPAGSRHGSFEASVERRGEAGAGVAFRGGLYDEERANGTALQENATSIVHGAFELDRLVGRGLLELRARGAEHELEQTFTAVAADRATERPVREQRVPSSLLGLAGRWSAPLGARHTLLVGLEAERRRGTSFERIFFPGRTLELAAGGEQEALGVVVEDVARLGPRLSAVAALRWDRWRNLPRAVSPGESAGEGPAARSEEMLSPRLALRFQPRPSLGLLASGYRSFRAPTLNELYRGFRVGDVVTAPNAALGAERLTGAEAGAVWTPAGIGGGLRLVATLFWMHLDDPIVNLTVGSGDGLVRRRRENLGALRSRGLEVDSTLALGDAGRWRLGAAFLWADAEVTDAPADPALEGRRVPQVPELQASARIGWRGRRTDVGLDLRWSGRQYDDDLNRFELGEALVVDLAAGHELAPGLDGYLAVENLLDEEVDVGRTPLRTVGSPRLVRLGVRWRR